MHIRELYPDVITEDLDYEYKYKSVLNLDNPVKWAKTIVGYANGKGGVMFVGVSNNGEAIPIRTVMNTCSRLFRYIRGS